MVNLQAAHGQGRKGGTPAALNDDEIDNTRQMVVRTDRKAKIIASMHGIKISTLYKYFPRGRATLSHSKAAKGDKGS
ncbi:hypothetical protein V8J82_22280 [Gymnodinialimonas sp. 2305UL16-5]|uniref:hypothetical protein n=1 Tax=Gymnodinialimonas mytili TaxID=3126503 RepID=UPI0030AF0E88